jgi:predicted TIM-barrel fold metal-dependent hydrolase
MGIANLLELGISEDEMRMMVQHNPAKLLGLDVEN